MSDYNAKIIFRVGIMVFLIAITTIGLFSRQSLAAEFHPGPEVEDTYASWSPGGGPSGMHCFRNALDINELTNFNGSFVVPGCEVRAGDFWSLFMAHNDVGLYAGWVSSELIPHIESGAPFYEFVVDEGMPQESYYKVPLKKMVRRNENGEVIVLKNSVLFPDDTSENELILELAPFQPESVGTHTVHLYRTIPLLGAFHRDGGIRTWTVVPQ